MMPLLAAPPDLLRRRIRLSVRPCSRLVVAALLVVAAASPSVAQQPSLQWQPMREAAFNAPKAKPTATAQEHSVLQRLWAKEIAGAREMQPGLPYPSAALIGTVQAGLEHFVFTSYARAGYEACEPAENGASTVFSHWMCPMRIARLQDGQAQAPMVRELSGYCMVWGDSADAPRARNRVEYAYDVKAATLHLRAIEHGKVVPRCNRSIRLQG
jgi:hypothetical protein